MQHAAFVTLPEFIRAEERKHTNATGDLSSILSSIALGTKVVSRAVAQAGLASMLGATGGRNIQGEEVQKLDEFADLAFTSVVGRSGNFLSIVSEEQDSLVTAKEGSASSSYVIAFDPVDGSSNIDCNVAIGTIFGVYRRLSEGPTGDHTDFFQGGRKQVAAGYTVYGSSTMFVFSTGNGVNGFTLDSTIGEYLLTHPNLRMPLKGKTYSCNEGNYSRWSAGVKAFIDYLKAESPKDPSLPHGARYVGSLVADFHRTLLKGGIFLYPADNKNKSGKLRLLYECAPLAFLAEQAGGSATDGECPILDLVATDIHQRVPLFIGSADNVALLGEFLR